MSSMSKPTKTPRFSLVTLVLVVLLLVAGGFAYYFYSQYSALKSNPQIKAQQEAADTIARVARLIVLPTGETPTVATVTEPDKLKDQAFFANAKKGYKVLIYTTAKKAILYDPVADKIVEVAPINIGAQAATQPAPSAPSKP